VPEKYINYKENYSWRRTLSISFLIFITFSIFQFSILFILLFIDGFDLNSIDLNAEIIDNASYSHIASISAISGLFGILLTIYFSKFIINPKSKSSKIKIHEILPLKKPTLKGIVVWLTILISYSIFISIISNWFGAIDDVDFTMKVLNKSKNNILLFYGIGVAQPIFEEFLFRGVLFKGLLNKLGGALTVLTTSFLFVLPHIQYDFNVLALILFPNALILGFSRLKTKSLTVPIILHCTNNMLTLIIGILN